MSEGETQRVLGRKQSKTLELKCSGSVDAKLRCPNKSEEGGLTIKLLPSTKAHVGYECQVCFVTFSNKYTLKNHLDHYRDPKYLCNDCGTKFSSAEILQSHIKYTHEIVLLRKYKLKCPVCNEMIRLETHLQSHLCHYHAGWEKDTNLNILVSECSLDETGTLPVNINNRESSQQTAVTKNSRKLHLIKLIKYLIRTMSNDCKQTTLTSGTDTTKLESLNNSYEKSDASINQKSVEPFVEIYGMPNEIEALLSDAIDVDVCKEENKIKSFDNSESHVEFKALRKARFTKDNSQNSLSNRSESDLKEIVKVWNDIGKQTNGEPSIEGSANAIECYNRDAALRILYSCKDCYVPLPRIDWRKKTLIEVVSRNPTTEGSTEQEQHRKNPLEKCIYGADDSGTCRETRGPVEQLENKRSEYEEREHNKFQLIDVETSLEKFSNSNFFIKSETNAYESYDASSVCTEPLEECFDPLSFSYKSEVDNPDIDKSSMENTDTFAQYPVSFNFPLKTEAVNCEASEISEVRTEKFGESRDSQILPFKIEPMDCDADGLSEVRTESFEEYPESLNFSIKTETVNNNYDEQSSEFADTSTECTDTLDTSLKIEIEDSIVFAYPECATEDTAERPETFNNKDTPGLDKSTSSKPGKKKRSVVPDQTMISSRICDKLYRSRRTMLRHFREKHLTCCDDSAICICGKEMIGSKLIENHFFRNCDQVIDTTDSPSDLSSPCKPLEKKYTCTKCGEKFWLKTCLEDHPPHCESPMTVSQNQSTKNHLKEFKTPNDVNDTGEYICEICEVKFTSAKTLLRHVRTFVTKEKHPCPYCGTIFTGVRLLKGHIQSTHQVTPAITYTFFCNSCNQGFTKKINKRIHTMHFHKNEVRQRPELTIGNYHPTGDGFAPVVIVDTPDNQCKVCNLMFISRKRFIDHISYYNKYELFRCNICGATFEGQYNIHHHRKKFHSNGDMEKMYTHYCAICKEGFRYKTYLHAHMFHVHKKDFHRATSKKKSIRSEKKDNSTDGQFPCIQCSKKFIAQSVLLAHIESHHTSGNSLHGRAKCTRCDKEFTTRSDWIFHLRHYHAIDPNDPLNVHLTNELSPSTECGNINDSMSSEKILVAAPVDSNPSETPQPCRTDETDSQKSRFGKIFLGREVLKAVDESKNLTLCTICGFDCPGPGGLARHKAMYLNCGIYVCEFCGRRFTWQSFYRDHKLKHFRRDVHNNCFCPVCDEGFETLQSLEMHTIHLHEKSLESLQRRSTQESSRTLQSPTSKNIAESGGSSKWKDENGKNIDNNVINDEKFLGECLNCDKECQTIEHEGQKHPTSVRKHNPFEDSDTPKNSSNSLDYRPVCNICRIIFATKEMLKFHRDSCHSFVKSNNATTEEPERPAIRQNNNTRDRFYVSLGNIHPKAIDSIGKRIYECNKAVGLTSNFYRYDVSLKCEICDLTFASRDALSEHCETLHKMRHDFQFVNTNVERKDSTAGTQTSDKVSTKIFGRADTESIGKTSRATFNNQFNYYYQCRVCDIIFIDKNLLAVHEENVHALKASDGHPSNEGFPRLLNSATTISQPRIDDSQQQTENKNLPTMQLVIQHSQSISDLVPVSAPSAVSPEEIWISDDETEDKSELSSLSTKNLSFGVNKRGTSPHRVRLVNLPPGNYKIAKFKVRTVDTPDEN